MLTNMMISIFVFTFALNAEIITVKDGKTYDFAEKDMVEEIQKIIVKDKDKINTKLKQEKDKALKWKPQQEKLTVAAKNRVFYPDMTYVVPDDIKDTNGRIMYPKGYKFNPADYVRMTQTIVIIDATNKLQIAWAKKNKYLDDMKYMVLLNDGNAYEMQKKYKKPFYYIDKKFSDKFKITSTPSLVQQVGNKIQVSEICLKDCQ